MIESNPSAHNDTTHARLVECSADTGCEILAPGHTLSLMRRRLAQATPSKWIDALVVGIGTDGTVDVTTLDDGTSLRLSHHTRTDIVLQVGEPVAVHSVYGVLAAGTTWLNVAGKIL
jgi:hypothetical protein